jgi:hypothetical protein
MDVNQLVLIKIVLILCSQQSPVHGNISKNKNINETKPCEQGKSKFRREENKKTKEVQM